MFFFFFFYEVIKWWSIFSKKNKKVDEVCADIRLGCICFAWKHFQEIILHPYLCLAATENTVKQKIIYALTRK